MDLDGLRIKLEAVFLVDQEFLDGLALVTLKLDDLSHFGIRHDGAIASELLLDYLQDLLVVKFSWESLNRSQRLAAIALLDTNMDIFLFLLRSFSGIFVGFGEGVIGLEVFDVGHKLWFTGVVV